ncbi:MAG: hypothetical protein ACREMB_26445 [Candidatus Rokuibacteriota bacterium]
MSESVRDVGILLAALTLGVGPFALLIALLNRRDRREARLLGAVCRGLSSKAMRSDVAVGVRCALLGRGAIVVVDMPGAAPGQVWEAMARLRALLPPAVRLRVLAPVDRSQRTRLTVERIDAGARPAAVRGLAC